MADTPSPTVTLPRELTPEVRAPPERAASYYGRASCGPEVVAGVWAALLLAADRAAAAS